MAQFTKLSNIYFIGIALLQMVKAISISGGKPVMIAPLAIVIGLSMIKDIFEDHKRYKEDQKENH